MIIEQFTRDRSVGSRRFGKPEDFRPALHESVVGEGFLGAFFAFTDSVEAVAELPSCIGRGPKLGY